ncbi:MAG TPA: replication initiation factor domain-containing protein [Nitrospira sp.]|nr:replication initiation factor domain-containing protein [Nitrospira sp.]
MESTFTLTVDWLAFTVLASNPQETMKVLGGDWSRAKGGFRGYPLSWIKSDGTQGVGKLGTNAPRRPNEIHVDLSGGLVSVLTLEQIRGLLRWVHEQQGHVTRIDCALDDRTTSVPMATIRQAVTDGHCVTRAAQVRQIVSNLTRGTGATTGETMYFGSPQSQTLLRIYDKRLEMQSKERENWQEFGVRWELEFKKDRAQLCARALASLDETDWKECVVGLLRTYVNFRQIPKDPEEEERYRAPMLEWYVLLTEGFQKGRLAQEKQVQTLQNVKRWVSDTLTPMLAVICATPGGEEWLQHEIVRGISRWKDRHRNLLKQPPNRFHPSSAGGNAGSPC